jgi:hypothetical protein
MLSLQSWIIFSLFLINLLYISLMSFLSPYYKAIMMRSAGKALNLIWISLLIVLSGILLMFNANCLENGTSCNGLSYSIIGILVLLTCFIIVYSSVKSHLYNKTIKH